MQRLLSFKHVSEIRRKLSNASFLDSHISKSFVYVTERNPKQLLNYSVAQHRLLSHFCFCSSRSWRSKHNISEKFSGFLSNPVLVKQIVSNTHLRISGLFNREVRFWRSQLPRQQFEFNPTFHSSRRSWTSWFPRPTADGMVLGLIVSNVAVFLLWRIANPTFMRKNFMISVENFTSGRVHTLITSAFSHMDVEHLVSNMIGLYFFGMNMARTFGPEFLLKLYLAGALGGSIFYLVHHAFLVPKGQGAWYMDPSRIPGLGASGAVNAIMLLDIFLNPKATIYLGLILPVPAMLMGVILIGKDILRIIEGDSQVSGSAHLGGAAVAAIVWARIKYRF